MYSAQETKTLDALTRKLLAGLFSIKAKNINDLREVLRFNDHRYYVLNDPLISDFEYDKLFKSLAALESEDPTLLTPDSPTQRVAKGLVKDFPKVQHLVPMLSLENSYNAEDLRDWDRKARELTSLKDVEYCVEPKFDGASISVIYEQDLLVRAATRGDGTEGDEITTNIKQIKSLPLSARFSKFNIQQVEIRGEVLMNKSNFQKYNDELAEQGLVRLANPRNAAAGSLRIKDTSEVGRRNLEAFLYHISYFMLMPGKALPDALKTHSGSLQLMWDLGFRSPLRERKVLKGIDAVIQFCNEYEAERDELPYEIDGMVIKVNNTALQDKMGMTSHHPRWAIAYKFKPRQATSILKQVEFQVGRTGSITPVAKIDPVQVGGVTVSSITLHNEDFIKEKNLMIGDTVLIERAGDVIPQVVKSLPDLRKGKLKKIVFPTHCPVCATKLEKSDEEAVWRCNNINCKAQVVERIIHFTSKDAMDIRGFGDANVRKFFELKFLNDIPGIYALPFDKIRGMEGYGEKSVTNLQTAIENSKKQPLNRLIYALGIRYVGETTAKTLARAITHLKDYRNYKLEDLQALEDVGPKVAGSIYRFFSNPDNIGMLDRLEKLGLNLKNEKKGVVTGGNLDGQTFLFTGTLPTLKRNEAETMVEANGGKLLGSVSSKLNYLVVGEEAGSKLEKAKRINTVKIISEAEFLQLINKT